MALRRGVPPGRRPPAVKAGGMRVSKKQENGPVEKNAKPLGKDKSSAIVSFTKPQNMGVLVAEALNKGNPKISQLSSLCYTLADFLLKHTRVPHP
ncbi:death-associated protein-like 1 isoform X2 [Catharus ustulatus]|uniref:death-associated protein-like 1 isoform X2 n=1 Tax=Catharus ustulatus TaxID=91951 RepID=UPI001C5BD34B|nr:death-associated protein-like 1 isoform X2 [Catharus ustulatus]